MNKDLWHLRSLLMTDPVDAVIGDTHGKFAARDAKVKLYVYAASSSTYGDHPGLPKVEDVIGKPLSPYAVTKLVNELYADVFGRCYGMESIGLRYFNSFGRRQDPNGAYAAVVPKWVSSMIHRVKETDGFAAMATELRKLGATVEEGQDYIQVTPPEKIKHAAIDTYDDHRMAMCFSLADSAALGCASTTPNAWRKPFPIISSGLPRWLMPCR